MKYCSFFILPALLLGNTLYAQATLSDRWKETQRLDLEQKPVKYSDTLRLLNVTKESMNLRKGSFMYKGEINNDLFDLGFSSYGIMKNTKEEIRLRDEEYIHIFSREVRDGSADDATAKKAGIDLPANPVTQISLTLIKGNWEVYKRSSRNGPLPKVDYNTMIKSISFPEQNSGDQIGMVMAGGADPLYVIRECKDADLIATDKDKKIHKLKVWRLTADELVTEDENNILYYLKHFR